MRNLIIASFLLILVSCETPANNAQSIAYNRELTERNDGRISVLEEKHNVVPPEKPVEPEPISMSDQVIGWVSTAWDFIPLPDSVKGIGSTILALVGAKAIIRRREETLKKKKKKNA